MTRPTLRNIRAVPHAPLNDATREIVIKHAGEIVAFYVAEKELFETLYERDGCFSAKAAADKARGHADTARRLMEDLIRGRSPEQVVRMEAAAGLDVPACANEEHGLA